MAPRNQLLLLLPNLLPPAFYMKKIVLLVAFLCSVLWLQPAMAQGLKSATGMLDKIGGANGEKIGVSADLGTSIATVIKTILALVGTIFLILTIYAGIMWMTAQGEDEKVTKALNMIRSAIIGLVIVMSAYAITYFVTSKLTGIGSSTQNSPVAPTSNNDDDNFEVMGCCYNLSSPTGEVLSSPLDLCEGSQEQWIPDDCSSADAQIGCCYDSANATFGNSFEASCQTTWSAGGPCSDQAGCCFTPTASGVYGPRPSGCNPGEYWKPGQC